MLEDLAFLWVTELIISCITTVFENCFTYVLHVINQLQAFRYSSPGWLDYIPQFLCISWFCRINSISYVTRLSMIKVWGLCWQLHNVNLGLEPRCSLLTYVFGVAVLLKHPFQGHFLFSIRQHDLSFDGLSMYSNWSMIPDMLDCYYFEHNCICHINTDQLPTLLMSMPNLHWIGLKHTQMFGEKNVKVSRFVNKHPCSSSWHCCMFMAFIWASDDCTSMEGSCKTSLLEPVVLQHSPVSDRAPPGWTDCWPWRFGLSPWFLARGWQPKAGQNEVQVPLEEKERGGRTGSQVTCIRCIQSIYFIRLNKYDVSSVAP